MSWTETGAEIYWCLKSTLSLTREGKGESEERETFLSNCVLFTQATDATAEKKKGDDNYVWLGLLALKRKEKVAAKKKEGRKLR